MLLCCFPAFLFTQQLSLKHFTTDAEINPLPASATIALHQDHTGYIWISAYSYGLLRYDGHTLVHYRMGADSLPGNIWAMFEGPAGHLWLAGESGYVVSSRSIPEYTPGERIRWMRQRNGVPLPQNYLVDHQVMVEGPDQRVWLSMDSSLLRLSPRADLPPDTLSLPFEPDEILYSMYRRPSGEIWLGSSEGRVFSYRADQDRFQLVNAPGTGLGPDAGQTMAMVEVGNRLWGGTNNGVLWRLDSLNGRPDFKTYSLDGRPYVKNMVSAGDVLLIGSREHGLIEFHIPDGSSRTYSMEEGLLHPSVWDVMRDREGNIWLAQNAGLSRLRADYAAFTYYDDRSPGNRPSVLPDPGINVVRADFRLGPNAPESATLAGTSRGLAIIRSTGESQVLTVDDGLPSDFILSLARDGQSRLWIGTTQGLACLADRPSLLRIPGADRPRTVSWMPGQTAYLVTFPGLSFTRYLRPLTLPGMGDKDAVAAFTTKAMYLLADNTWYLFGQEAGLPEVNDIRGADIGPDGRIYLSDVKEGVLRSSLPLSLDRLRDSVAFRPGQDFMGTAREVSEAIIQKVPISFQDDTLQHVSTLGFSGDTLWLATDEGLLAFSVPEMRNVHKISHKEQGREVYNFVAIEAQADPRQLWAGAQSGLYAFDKLTGQELAHIERSDGLVDNQMWGMQGLDRDALGRLYYATPAGLSIYDPAKDEMLEKGPEPAFSRVQYEEDAWGNNSVQFEYAALSFADEKEVRYRTRLNGYENAWSSDTTASSIRYTNLPAFLFPRQYRFEVLAANADGVWAEDPASYSFTVKPAWWLRWWAFLIYAGIIFIGMRLYIRSRLKAQEEALEKERKVTERLRAVDKLKDQFLANTSHELRTPLNGIIGLADGLIEGAAGKLPRQALENLDLISSSGQRLASLVNDILDFSSLQHKDITLDLEPVDVYAVADIVVTLSRPLAANKPVELINAVPRDMPPVRADENRLEQILFNLIGNAVKFTHEGKVSVGARMEGDMVRIQVEDTGIGIAPDKQEDIFLSFQQADGSISRTYGGTGLGLTICKQLVELHGGKIGLESTPGKGSVFFFTLPRYQGEDRPRKIEAGNRKMAQVLPDPEEALAPAETQMAAAGVREDIRILIVDDEPVNLQVLDNHLSMAGYQVVRARNGEEALRLIEREWPIDLVLLDIMMPHMSGFEVCEKIRQKHSPGELPVVMVTAKNRVADLVFGFKAGANDYLSKPFAKDELLSRVQTHLRLHRIHSATGKFVPHEFLRAIGRETIMDVQLGDQTEREITVLFSDIRDYTTLSETMTPDQTFRFVNAYNQRIGPIIRQHHGFVNQYLGDAIMALFPESPTDALRAAVDVQARLHTYNTQRRKRGRLSIRSGVGIHTGFLIMGIIGDKDRMDAATISDTVNTAARLESLTKHYGASILLSEETLRRKDPKLVFPTRYLGQVQVKGKSETVGIVEGIDGDEAPLRDLKLATLQQFNLGREAFYQREFAEAVALFAEIVRINPDDAPASLFLRRARKLMQQGVPENWTGIEIMERK